MRSDGHAGQDLRVAAGTRGVQRAKQSADYFERDDAVRAASRPVSSIGDDRTSNFLFHAIIKINFRSHAAISERGGTRKCLKMHGSRE